MSPDVYMYTTRFCPFCERAKQVLSDKAVPFRDIPVDGNPELRREMQSKAGSRSVPQIWINDQHIGGCRELMQLEVSGELDEMLAATV